MKTKHKQSGLTFISWLFAIFFIVVIAYASMKIVPAYLENYMLNATLEKIITELHPETNTLTVSEFETEVSKKFDAHLDINGIYSVTKNDLKMTQLGDNSIDVKLSYDRTENLIGNLDVTMHFSKTFKGKIQ